MLDLDIIEQLKSVFEKINNSVEFNIKNSKHADQVQLEEMLNSIVSTSPQFKINFLNEVVDVPEFGISINGEVSRISFKGIPGGHEFTSLIVAILNLNGLGKLPDQMIINKIKSLKGPIDLKTYISLTCENCPDVVQALNLMAIYNKNFRHQMVDGGYVQDEIKELGIQGVPSVIGNKKLISSGKTQLIDLLNKLEPLYGVDENFNSSAVNLDLGKFDVVVIGGGPAGSSAAIYTVRKGLKTALLCERIGGQVQDTKGIENLISTIYTEGPQLAAQLKNHLENYPVSIYEHRRIKNIENGELKKIELESGEYLFTKSIIVATGAKWRELNIPGEKEYIGRGVAFCPHCDGPYYKGKKVAVVGGGNSGVEAAIDLAGIVREVILFEYMENLKADQVLVEKLKSLPNVTIITNAKTDKVIGNGEKVTALEYVDRQTNETREIDLDGIFVQIGLLPNSHFVKNLVEVTKSGEIVIDVKGRTSTPGIYAAGDVTTVPYKQIIIAMGEGAKAGLSAFEDQMIKG